MPHLPLFTMPTCIHLFLSYFCFFWPQNDLFFYALEPILCHFLRTLILTICCSVAQLCLTLSASWTAACQASLSFTISWSLLKHVHESMTPSNHLIVCYPLSSCPQSCPASGSFPMSQLFTSGGQSIGASTSASVIPVKVEGWFLFGWTDVISLVSKGLSSTTVQKRQFFSTLVLQ